MLDWNSKRQNVVATSSTEAEVVALATAMHMSVVPIADLCDGVHNMKLPIRVYTDSEPAQKAIARGYSANLKSMGRFHSIRISQLHEIFDTHAELLRVDTRNNRADYLTKPLSADVHRRHDKYVRG